MKFLKIFCILIFLTACAKQSSNIQATYMSPLQYQGYTCQQLKAEITRVGRKMSDISGQQDKTASNDTAAMAAGMILFWPALFLIDSSDHRLEVARLKGEFDALEQAAIQKKCYIAEEINKARELEATRMKASKKVQEPAHKAVSRH